MTVCGRLPVVYTPEADERLSSWVARIAPFYAMTVSEFVATLGLKGHDVFDLEWRLSEGQGALIAARTGLSPEAVQAMTFREFGPQARSLIAAMSSGKQFVRPGSWFSSRSRGLRLSMVSGGGRLQCMVRVVQNAPHPIGPREIDQPPPLRDFASRHRGGNSG